MPWGCHNPNILPYDAANSCHIAWCLGVTFQFGVETITIVITREKVKVKQSQGSWRLRLPELAVGTRRWQGCQPYAPTAFTRQEITLVLISVKRMGQPQGHSAAGRIKSMTSRTRSLPPYSTVHQPTAPLRAPDSWIDR